MRLLLSDFCPEGTLTEIYDQTISISHAELAGILTEAEGEEAMAEAPSSSNSSEENVPFVSKRKRPLTPKLTSEDEAEFERAETATTKRNLEDGSFSSADAVDAVVERAKRIKTRSQPDSEPSP
ncbi:hypothetical protein CC80DRAFT_556128 [Byssothecium circinans]|uniref:Uncharacterized protein n=1 Tax=Byssothecium circinans TaxID=147558 RepID=A0A6A5T7K3_9PLEO|nr:hypothetical protein CC80DRAFT_556128 [Byssothecium circinans]